MSRTAIRHGITLFFPFILAACPAERLPPDEETGSTSTSGSSGGEASTTDASTGIEPATTSSSTGDASTGEASTGADSSSGEPVSTGAASSTGAPGVCGDGRVDPGEECDDGGESLLCDDDCTDAACGDLHVNAAAGEECDDGNANDLDECRKDCTLPACGDGVVSVGEECDDGNAQTFDACSNTCEKRWENVGIVEDIPVDSLKNWKLCWSGTYEGSEMQLAAQITTSCTGDHILVGCRAKNDTWMSVAAHAPRSDVFHLPEPNYPKKERHIANGVGWFWSPSYSMIGFGPEGDASPCNTPGVQGQLCWGVYQGAMAFGGRCGKKIGFSIADAPLWERLVFESWD